MTDAQAPARVWTLCLAARLTPLAYASSPALTIVAAVLGLTLVGAYVTLAALLIVAVRRDARRRRWSC